MSFFKEIAGVLGLDAAAIAGGYQVINYNGGAVYVEGFKRLISISDTEILLDLKKQRVKISGEGLNIHTLENTTIIVKGKITAVITE